MKVLFSTLQIEGQLTIYDFLGMDSEYVPNYEENSDLIIVSSPEDKNEK